MLLCLSQDEDVFKTALHVASELAISGADKRSVVEAAESVVAAAIAVQKKLDEQND